MKYDAQGQSIVLEGITDFHIEHILECGQCFRFQKITQNHYKLIAYGKQLFIRQEEDYVLFYPTSIEEFTTIWIPYFDLERNYTLIKKSLSSKDPILQKAIAHKPGIRILQQDPWECLISFIISQNKKISHIQQVIQNICETFGNKITVEEGIYYTFPTPQQLSQATETDIRACKAGFRAPYIVDACQKVIKGEIDLNAIKTYRTIEAKKELLKIKGVGPKISDCVLLFAYGRYEVFPTDVWIRRMMQVFYLGEDATLQQIQEYAAQQFGNLGGFAQQYLFYYGREKQITKIKK